MMRRRLLRCQRCRGAAAVLYPWGRAFWCPKCIRQNENQRSKAPRNSRMKNPPYAPKTACMGLLDANGGVRTVQTWLVFAVFTACGTLGVL